MRKPTLSIDTSIHEVLLGDSPCGVRYATLCAHTEDDMQVLSCWDGSVQCRAAVCARFLYIKKAHESITLCSPTCHRCTQGNPGIFLCSQDPAEIIPNVFIGSVDVAKDVDRLSQHGIQAVVNASKVMYTLPSSISRIQVEVDDTPTVNLACHFHKTSQFIQQQVEQGELPQ